MLVHTSDLQVHAVHSEHWKNLPCVFQKKMLPVSRVYEKHLPEKELTGYGLDDHYFSGTDPKLNLAFFQGNDPV